MEKTELHSVMQWQFWPIRSFHCIARFILNNELWNKFLLGYVDIVWEVLQKLVCSSGVSILDTIWQTLCLYAKMHKIFIAQKSHCACRVLILAAIRSKHYFNFILNRTRSGRELFDHPSQQQSLTTRQSAARQYGQLSQQQLGFLQWQESLILTVEFVCNTPEYLNMIFLS